MPSPIQHVPTPHSYSAAVAAGDWIILGLHRGRGEQFAPTQFIDADCLLMIDGLAFRGK